MRTRSNYRAYAAAQFWLIDEFVTEFIPVPFIDELLMPVVFMLNRRVWLYAQTYILARALIAIPRLLTGQAVFAPLAFKQVISYVTIDTSKLGKDFVSQSVFGFYQSIISLVSSSNGYVELLVLLIFASTGTAYLTCWFWAGWLNHYIRRYYGPPLVSGQFSTWNRLRLWSIPIRKLDTKIRGRVPIFRDSPLGVFPFYMLLAILIMAIVAALNILFSGIYYGWL